MSTSKSKLPGRSFELVPLERYRNAAEMRSLYAKVAPFSLSVDLFYANDFDGKIVPSISSDIAGINPTDTKLYRPD